jgi:hypothetical protein
MVGTKDVQDNLLWGDTFLCAILMVSRGSKRDAVRTKPQTGDATKDPQKRCSSIQ